MTEAYNPSHAIAPRRAKRNRVRIRWDRLAMLGFCLVSWAAMFAAVRWMFFR